MPDFQLDNTGFTEAESLLIQRSLAARGYDPGPIDGIIAPPSRAPRTSAAIVAFKRARGLRARPYLGPKTWAALIADLETPVTSYTLPWLREGMRMRGLHERHDNAELRAWLGSDGHALGDPAVFPWCGDFVETCIRLALPDEPFPGDLGINPYWALNWRLFGEPCKPSLGAVVAMSRHGGGHVFFAVGEDDSRVYALGGNQSNTVSVVPVDKSRVPPAAWRRPVTWGDPLPPLPRFSSTAEAETVFA